MCIINPSYRRHATGRKCQKVFKIASKAHQRVGTARDDYTGVTEAELPRLGHIHIFTTLALLDHNAGGTGSYAHGNRKLGTGNLSKSLFLALLREIWGAIGVSKRKSGKLGALFFNWRSKCAGRPT